MLRRFALLAALCLLGLGVAGVLVLRAAPELTTDAPTAVAGTEATSVFQIGDRTVRQIRYADGGTLRYTFRITNAGRLPLTIQGLAEHQPRARLFTYLSLRGADSSGPVRLGAGEEAAFTLSLRMGGCESLSSRAGSFVTEVAVRTERVGLVGHDVLLTLPEQVHTGSPREAFCPRSTATSRPQG